MVSDSPAPVASVAETALPEVSSNRNAISRFTASSALLAMI